jgi:GNAT superfamily N-acetyltransferase
MKIDVVLADYRNPQHQSEIPHLLDCYSRDPMGGGEPLSEDVTQRLVKELSKLPNAFSLIAYADGKPAGLANCFHGFSTFACKPLINIHDIVVLERFRGKGISQYLLQRVERIALEKGCCKITLEVLSNNLVAQSAYRKFGFGSYELNSETGEALFWEKHFYD